MGTPADCTMMAALARLREAIDWELDHMEGDDAVANLQARVEETPALAVEEIKACHALYLANKLPFEQTNPTMIYIDVLACQIAGSEWVGAQKGLTWNDQTGWE